MQSVRKVAFRGFFLSLVMLAAAVSAAAGVFSFEDHWKQPIPPQGPAPDDFSEAESSLFPEDCGDCHEDQYRDWRESRHARSIGPGVLGQLNPPWLDKEGVESCLNCHAPLAEQRIYSQGTAGRYVANPNRQKGLLEKGLSCAGCHVRKHVRYGPKPKQPLEPPLPHNGFVEVDNFGASEFCRPCHQFEPYHRRVAGKLLEDTYEQWKASSYAKKGTRCADCHMPGRRHLWKGVHDPDMVKSGVDITATRRGDSVSVIIKNTGVGHLFPTYVTPQVAVRAFHAGGGASTVIDEKWIGWYIELDLSGERYDTRIPPGETAEFRFTIPKSAAQGEFGVSVTVYPDDFYNRFFKALLASPPQGVHQALLQDAYDETLTSPFSLFEKRWPLAGQR